MKKLKTLKSILKQGDFSESESKIIEKAYLFAEKAHKGQLIGKMPFFHHPAYAGYFLAKCKQDAKVISAGLLHDVIEDCRVKLSEIKIKFGEKVAFYVDGMTVSKRKIKGKWKKDYKSQYKKFSDYVKRDPILAILEASDEMSRSNPKNFKRTVEKLKEKGIWEDYKKWINERMRGFWIPFFEEIGFSKVVRKMNMRAKFVKEEKIEITLYSYISKKELRVIKTNLRKVKGIEFLRN